MRGPLCVLASAFLLAACTRTVEEPGRATPVERGPTAKVYPSDGPPRIERHGLWRGLCEKGSPRWEVRHTRGKPSGPYREWNERGQLRATWPYDWEGRIDGWARWYEEGHEVFKFNLDPSHPPPFDPIGRADELRLWAETHPKHTPASL